MRGAGACVGDLCPRGPGNSGYDLSPERPLHFAEKVLPILHGLGTDSYLVVKKHQSMEAMLLYLGRWRTWVGGVPGEVVPSGPGRLVGPSIQSSGGTWWHQEGQRRQ